MPVLHAGMMGLVQIMDHYSLAYAGLDTPVTAAKRRVNIIFENVLDVFSLLSISIPERFSSLTVQGRAIILKYTRDFGDNA